MMEIRIWVFPPLSPPSLVAPPLSVWGGLARTQPPPSFHPSLLFLDPHTSVPVKWHVFKENDTPFKKYCTLKKSQKIPENGVTLGVCQWHGAVERGGGE